MSTRYLSNLAPHRPRALDRARRAFARSRTWAGDGL